MHTYIYIYIYIYRRAFRISGTARKRSERAKPCGFTEFCNSPCLSHFAAPFVVARAETSVAESCK